MTRSTEQMVKKTIGVLSALFLLSVAYYGSYLPLVKSMTFISTMQNAGSAHSVGDFEKLFEEPLNAPSPIGQEELVRNTASTVLGTLQNVNDPPTVAELNKFIMGYYQPLLDRGHGMSFGQDVYIVGALNELSFVKTQNPAYLQAAEKYYTEAVDLGPDRPQGLYGLFDIYRMQGNVSQVKATAEKILMLWPTDDRTRGALADYLAGQPSSTPVAK